VSQKPENVFRNNTVVPFIRTLEHTVFFSIQQVSLRGHPDLFLCCRGLFIVLELKDLAGKASKLQKYWMRKVLTCGGIAIIVDRSNWKEVKKLLNWIDKGGYHEYLLRTGHEPEIQLNIPEASADSA